MLCMKKSTRLRLKLVPLWLYSSRRWRLSTIVFIAVCSAFLSAHVHLPIGNAGRQNVSDEWKQGRAFVAPSLSIPRTFGSTIRSSAAGGMARGKQPVRSGATRRHAEGTEGLIEQTVSDMGATSLQSLTLLLAPVLGWVSAHPVASGTFTLIVGWAAVEGPNSSSRALFREALKLVAAVAFLSIVPGALYGELVQPGYITAETSMALQTTYEYVQANLVDILLAVFALVVTLALPPAFSATALLSATVVGSLVASSVDTSTVASSAPVVMEQPSAGA